MAPLVRGSPLWILPLTSPPQKAQKKLDACRRVSTGPDFIPPKVLQPPLLPRKSTYFTISQKVAPGAQGRWHRQSAEQEGSAPLVRGSPLWILPLTSATPFWGLGSKKAQKRLGFFFLLSTGADFIPPKVLQPLLLPRKSTYFTISQKVAPGARPRWHWQSGGQEGLAPLVRGSPLWKLSLTSPPLF